MTEVGQTHNPLSVYDEIAAELSRVALDATPPASCSQELNVTPYGFPVPRAQERAFHLISPVHLPFRVKQYPERYAGFLYPGLCCRKRAKRDNPHLGVQFVQVILVQAQLRHMLAAGQSPQVAQENQQGVVPVLLVAA